MLLIIAEKGKQQIVNIIKKGDGPGYPPQIRKSVLRLIVAYVYGQKVYVNKCIFNCYQSLNLL